jgi:hypothetical protein
MHSNPGCFAQLTCSDRIVLARLSAAIQNQALGDPRRIVEEELARLSGTQRARILRSIHVGKAVLPAATFTELTAIDQANITFVEEIPGVSLLAEEVLTAAAELAREARSIRDASLTSHLWMVVADGTEVGLSRIFGVGLRGIPLVELANTYRAKVAALDDRVRSKLEGRHLPFETITELRGSYQKRITQLSEQLVLEIEQASASITKSQGAVIFPLELVAEAGLLVASSGASSIALRSAMRVGAISGMSATATNAGRAAHAAFASNDTKFFCELSENTVSNPAIFNIGIGWITGGFLGKLVSAQSVGVRAFGGALSAASVTGVTSAVEVARWNDAETALLLAREAQESGRVEEAACFLQAREQQLAGIAIDLTTLAAGTFTGISRKPTQAELRAAEQSRIASARLNQHIGLTESTVGVSDSAGAALEVAQGPLPAKLSAQTATRSAQLFRKDQALRLALDDMKKVDDLLDLSIWDRLWIRAEAREVGGTLTLTLFNRLTGGRVCIDIKNADAAAAERVISRRQVDAVYDALTLGERIALEL